MPFKRAGSIILSFMAFTVSGLAMAASTADTSPKPPCIDNTSACLEKIAQLYLDALLTHDGSKLPLAKNVRRTENALTNARGDYEVRESFKRTHMVEGVREARFYTDVARGDIVVFFRGDVDLKDVDAKSVTKAGDSEYKVAVTVPAGTYTIHEAERFRIVKGYITEIEIIAHVEKGKGAGSGWPVERIAPPKDIPAK